MSKRTGIATSARLWERRAGGDSFWDQVIQLGDDPQFVPVFLFSVIGLLVALCLAILFGIPGADSLLAMGG